MNNDYSDFLKTKVSKHLSSGKNIELDEVNPILHDFQKDVVKWAVRKGRAAVFLDTGLGKTFVQLEWARLINVETLIIAPLSVARQTAREAKKLGIDVKYVRSQDEIEGTISITNYEMIDHFDFDRFGAVVLDESSILKAIAGKTKKKLIDICRNVPYKLSCTATPAPNDYIEIGNQVEWLGVCKANEMLAMFFINANKEHTYLIDKETYRRKGSNKGGTEWRLKHHAEDKFYRWMASWSVMMTKPSDLGYDDTGYDLPKLRFSTHYTKTDFVPEGQLLFTHIKGIKGASQIRKNTAEERLEVLKDLIDGSNDQWIIWCGLNEESKMVHEAFNHGQSVEVKGADSPEHKVKAFEDFQDGEIQILVTKPRIGGFGMNFQNAHKMVFFGLSYSWEQFYQAVRREWRYMQEHPVDVHIIMSDIEASIYKNVMRKDAMAKRLRSKMIENIRIYEEEELQMKENFEFEHDIETVQENDWTAMRGDSCERIKELGENTIDLSVYSPPFADLYTYSNSERDLGNSKDWEEFFYHYSFLIKDILRVTKPGRLTCVHVSDIPAMAQKDGYIGIKDFPGEVIRAYDSNGWTFVGRAYVQKNPQAQAIRTKSKALLFVQMRKDSASSRPALVDQILLFRKPGENAVPITPVDNGEMDNETWINWAHGIWTGISETNTLQYSTARGEDDEKHICPLQLETIERCIKLYSNPGETVLTPFGGIGSEGYQAVKFGRKAILMELKPEYFKMLLKNMRSITASSTLPDLFAWAEQQKQEAV